MEKNGTWLIVGGDGLIGQRLAADAKRLTDRVVVSSRRQGSRTGQLFFDLTVEADMKGLLSVTPEVVFLCAAMTSIQSCHDSPELSRQTNVTGTVRLAAQFMQRGCFVVFLSSNAVFDGNTERPDEDSRYCPTTEYGRQKVSAEQQLVALSKSNGSVAIVRLSKVLTSASGMSAEFMKCLKAGKPCRAFNDLRMSPVSLSYVVDTLVAVAQSRQSGIFHLSGAEEMTYADFAKQLVCDLGGDVNWVRSVSSTDSGVDVLFRPKHPALGMKRTHELLGIEPEPTAHLFKELVEGK